MRVDRTVVPWLGPVLLKGLRPSICRKYIVAAGASPPVSERISGLYETIMFNLPISSAHEYISSHSHDSGRWWTAGGGGGAHKRGKRAINPYIKKPSYHMYAQGTDLPQNQSRHPL